MPYLQPAPPAVWEPYRQACSLQAVHWLSKGLADYNPKSANPSDVWANDTAYHDPPPKVMAKRGTTPSFRSKGIAQSQYNGLSWRFFRVARSGGNVPAWLVCIFQATDERFFISRSSYSPRNKRLLVIF